MKSSEKKLKKINKKTKVYVFATFGLTQYEERFKLKNVDVIPVPEPIMAVYKRLFLGIKKL